MAFPEKSERNWEILKLHQKGISPRIIAKDYEIHESRVCHIVKAMKKKINAKSS